MPNEIMETGKDTFKNHAHFEFQTSDALFIIHASTVIIQSFSVIRPPASFITHNLKLRRRPF